MNIIERHPNIAMTAVFLLIILSETIVELI